MPFAALSLPAGLGSSDLARITCQHALPHVTYQADRTVRAGARQAVVAAEAAESEVAGAAEEAESSLASDAEHAGEGGCSFSYDTSVATPTGERAIGSLQVGDHVTAYDPMTGKTSTQTVQHVWINHDNDLIDLTLRVTDQQQAAAAQNKQQEVALRAHGLRAPPADSTATTHDEVIHTTSRHPWLTTDQGFVATGELHLGEGVVREGAPAATIVGLRVVPGAGTMYNLTVSVLHTYAVGASQFVVHNTGAACSLGGEGQALPNPKGREFVRVWRAVTRGELDDIKASGEFRNPFGTERKYFSLDRESAMRYGREAFAQWPHEGPYTLVSGKFPRALIQPDMLAEVDRGIPALTIPSDLLPMVSDVRINGFIG